MAQAAPALHCPLALQVSGTLPLHRRLFGVQETQTPFWQATPQAVALVQAPLVPQVCGTSPVQRLAPGAHPPVQAPLLHVEAQVVPLIQAPAALQL